MTVWNALSAVVELYKFMCHLRYMLVSSGFRHILEILRELMQPSVFLVEHSFRENDELVSKIPRRQRGTSKSLRVKSKD